MVDMVEVDETEECETSSVVIQNRQLWNVNGDYRIMVNLNWLLRAVTMVMVYELPGMNVKAFPVKVQLEQLEPMRKLTGMLVLLNGMVGPAHDVIAYWFPDVSVT